MSVSVTLLGVAQDGGRPQAGCARDCCAAARRDPALRRWPVALAIRDPQGVHLVEATRLLEQQLTLAGTDSLASLWVTHAHLGHVDGLGLLGREAMAVSRLPLHCSPAFAALVDATPAWRQLVARGHLVPTVWQPGVAQPGGEGWRVTPLAVPHRGELCDTHALLVAGPRRRLLFLPDHDAWEATLAAAGASDPRAWFAALEAETVLLDGTFWSADELPRQARQARVPHPPVQETLARLGERRTGDPRVLFIHLNHTNPLHDPASPQSAAVAEAGWEVGREEMVFAL